MHKGSIPTAKKPKKSLSCALDKKQHRIAMLFFYPSRRLGISPTLFGRCISSLRSGAYHRALACIFLWLDDINCFAVIWLQEFKINIRKANKLL